MMYEYTWKQPKRGNITVHPPFIESCLCQIQAQVHADDVGGVSVRTAFVDLAYIIRALAHAFLFINDVYVSHH